MLRQAIEERSYHNDVLPTYLYFDEAEPYFDEQFPKMLSGVRKHNIGIVIAHQFLDQANKSKNLISGLVSLTSTKFVGGVSPRDARALAPAMETTADFIRAQPKGYYAAYVKGTTPKALALQVPFFTMENMPKMDPADKDTVRDVMRAKYAVSTEEEDDIDPEPEDEDDVIYAAPEADGDIVPSKEL